MFFTEGFVAVINLNDSVRLVKCCIETFLDPNCFLVIFGKWLQ